MKPLSLAKARFALGIFSVFSVVFAPCLSRATGTGNAFVWGEVQDGTGLITIYTAPGPVGGERLSYQEKSYLSVKIGTKIYTNNNWVLGQPNVYPLTSSGSLSVHKCTSGETGDTVRCTWSDKSGVDIIQDVWPVAFDRYGQIVISVKFRNKTSGSANVQAQYLLDTEPANDKSKVLTKWSFSPKWQVYPSGVRTVPELFITFQNQLPFPAQGPGITGVGYFDSPGAPLYLIKPTRVTIGDWASNLSGIVWGPQSPMPSTDYGDSGILMEFGGTSVLPGKTVEAMRTSYGTDDWIPCAGKLFTLTKYPQKLKYNGTAYTPNPFLAQTFACNTDVANSSANTYMRLTVGPNLTITSPTPVTVDGAGHSTQNQAAGSGGNIPPLDVAYVTWTVNATLYAPCTSDLDTWLQLTATTSLGSPAIIGCDLPITLPCTNLADVQPPMIDNWAPISQDGDAQSFSFHDNNTGDKGLHWPISYSGTNLSNFAIYIDSFADCWRGNGEKRIDVQQIDTCIAGCINFHITDCAGNATDTLMCFKARKCAEKPHIKNISFAVNYIDSILLVHGEHFGQTGKLVVDGIPATVERWTDTLIQAHTTTAGPGEGGRVQVICSGDSSNERWLTLWSLFNSCETYVGPPAGSKTINFLLKWRADITDAPFDQNSGTSSVQMLEASAYAFSIAPKWDSTFIAGVTVGLNVSSNGLTVSKYNLYPWSCKDSYRLSDSLLPIGGEWSTVKFLPPHVDLIRRPILLAPKLPIVDLATLGFFWMRIFDTSQIQISVENSFKSSSLVLDTVVNTFSLPYTNLTERQKYYWRVREKSSDGYWGFWSITDSFTVGPVAAVHVQQPSGIQVRYTTSRDAINFHITTPGEEASQFEIYDVLGVRVAEYALDRGKRHDLEVARSSMSGGAYFYRVQQGNAVKMGKVMVP